MRALTFIMMACFVCLGPSRIMAMGSGDLFYPRILEVKWVGMLSVKPDDVDNPLKISVSGLCNHSSLVVSVIDLERNGSVLNMLVKLEPAKKGMSGSFQKEIDVSNGITCITFGKDQIPIWRRSTAEKAKSLPELK